MEIFIDIPDDIFESAEKAAKKLGISRDQLYSNALTRYLKLQQNDEITRKLNLIYGDDDPDRRIVP